MSDAEKQPVEELCLRKESMPVPAPKEVEILKENSDGLTKFSGITSSRIADIGIKTGITSPERDPQDVFHHELDFEGEDTDKNDEESIRTSEIEVKEEPVDSDTYAEVDGETHPEVDGETRPEVDGETRPEVDGETCPEVGERHPEVDGDTHTEADGLCTKIKEEPKDDGECSDGGDEDLEEGELNDDSAREDSTNSKPNTATKQVCRFYSKGQCFFGSNCRFAHVNSASGNYYSMFAPSTQPRVPFSDYYDTNHGMMNHRSGPLPPRSTGSDFLPPPPVCSQPAPAEENAWGRALQTAKELVRAANKRKIEDADFSEKSLNLSLNVNEKNVPEFLENDTSYKKKRRDVPFIKYEDEPHEGAYDDYEARTQYRHGFDNFDARYHREGGRRGDRGRDRVDRDQRDKREFRPKSPRSKERFRDDRVQEVQPRSRDYSRDANEYFDPWRRSKSPKGTARRSRSRSGSYSSVSSYSWSDRSFSSNSYSHSSRSSSRSPPPNQKRKQSPTLTNPAFVSDKLGPPLTNTFTTMKKKPVGRREGGSSRSRTPSISRSRSRSFSRSISMSSVSSASSRDSLSNSSGSLSRRQISLSDLWKEDENPPLPVGKTIDTSTVPSTAGPSTAGPSTARLSTAGPSTARLSTATIPLKSIYLNYQLKEEQIREIMEGAARQGFERDPLVEQFMAPKDDEPFPSLLHLLPTYDKKEPLKAPHKQQIKLTLLKKPLIKLNSMPKQELDVNRKPTDEPSKSSGFYFGVKSPLSPPTPPVIARPTPVLIPKKSPSSRRDELLKQLKAVEDAIARKRAKFG